MHLVTPAFQTARARFVFPIRSDQRHFHSFNCRKCLKQIFTINRFSETPIQTPNLFCLFNYCKDFAPSLPSILLRTALDCYPTL